MRLPSGLVPAASYAAGAVSCPQIAARLLGNGPAASRRVYLQRLLYDLDRP